MAITTYSELKSALSNWLNRGDLTSRLDEFLDLAEARIKRNLRTRTVVDDITLDAQTVALPADLGELRFLRLNDGVNHAPIEITSPVAVADMLNQYQGTGDKPVRAAVVEGNLYLAPTPDQSYTAEITYYQSLTPLSEANPTNFVLDAAPDLYLAGALIEAFMFLDWDEKVPAWESKFQAALEELERARERSEYSAAPAPVRLPVVFD